MLRRILIGLCLLATLVVMIPLVSSTAHNLRAQFSASSHRRRHSRAWWRRHRAMLRRRQAMLARRRAMRAECWPGEMELHQPSLRSWKPRDYSDDSDAAANRARDDQQRRAAEWVGACSFDWCGFEFSNRSSGWPRRAQH